MFGLFKKKTPNSHIRANENGTHFERHLYYAQNGGLMYQFYTGYDYALGIKKGDAKHPDGVKQDISTAISFLEKAANRDVGEAQELLGLIYFGKLGETYIDLEKSFHWFTKAAQNGSAHAQYMIGIFYETGVVVEKDMDMAYHWYLESSNSGDEAAMGSLCEFYRNKALGFSPEEANGSKKKDFRDCVELSFKWGKKAADLGNYEAAYLTGVAYYSGFGIPADKDEAKRYFQMAASCGQEDAQQFLSENY